MKWYQKTWVIVLLLIFFFPAGVFLMWKEKKNWLKPIKVGLSVVLGFWFLLFNVALFSDTSTETSTASTKIESKTVANKIETKTIEKKKPNVKLADSSLTIKDNEEKEVEFTLENLKESDVKVVISDGTIASSEIKDGKCIVKGISKGNTTLQFNSKNNITLAKLNISVEESQETIAKKEAEKKAKQEAEAKKAEEERIAQEKAEQEKIAAEQAEAERQAQANAQAQQQQVIDNSQSNTIMVWKTRTGKKYHMDANCGNSNSSTSVQITREEALNMGMEPCSKCAY